MKTFSQFLLEMPHMILPSGKVIDLELETLTKKSPEEFLGHVSNLLSGQAMKTRYGHEYRLDHPDDVAHVQDQMRNDPNVILNFAKRFHPNTLPHLHSLLGISDEHPVS